MNRRYTFSTSAVEELLNDIFGEYTTYSYYENFYILYATSLTANYFTAAGNQETVTVGNNNNKRYLKICSSTSASNPIYFYSVTYNYLDGSTSTIYVPSGTEITLPGNSISWENDSTGTKYSSGTTYTVTGKTSFTETSYSVSYVYLDGTTYTDTVELNDIIYLRTTAYGWTTNYSDYYDSGEQYEVLASVTFYEAAYNITYEYLDGTTYTDTVKMNTAATLRTTDYGWTTDGDTTVYLSGESYTPTGDVTFTEAAYTVTYEYLDGTTSTVYVKIGDSVTLAATSYGWTITGTDSYSSGATYTPTGDVTFTEAAYTVTYYDAGGSLLETVYVPIGDTITLRATDYVWEDTSGNTYSSGAAYTPTADIAFTEHDETLTVTYTLNYPSVMQAPAASKTYYNQGYYGYTADMPYITEAGSGSTTYSYTAHQSQLFTTASPSEQIVEALMIRWDNTRYYAVYFDGWTVTVNNTTYTYAAGEEIDWATLTTLAGTGGTISFTGSWTYDTTSTVNFFVRWNNASVGSSTNLFTDPVFTTYVYNGTASYDITDSDTTNDDNSYASNLLVRALAEYQSDSIPYLYDFPDDEYTFAQLKSMIDDDTTLIVDGIDVKISELTTDYYEIRWYNFKYDSLDGWHINGKLVRKTGDINIYKTFEGNADSIADDKADFYITATSQLDGDSETFDLTNYTDYDAATDTYHWVLEDVTYKEEWVISEKDVDVGATYSRYTSYRVVDSTGNESQTGTGTSVTVYGMVYQKDIGEDEALNVYFTNIYTAEDTIIVRKVDSMTGNTMSGSGFEVYRYGTEKVTFDVDADGTYVENTGGTGAEDTLTINNGYVTVEVDRDYMLEFRETLTPTGYEVPTEYIQLDNSTGSLAVTQGGDYAEYSNGVLTVYNTPTTADITVTKTWTSDATPADITLWLMSDNRTAAALLPNWTGSSEVTLTASAGVWTYTWDDVPLYADGAALNWSVLETKIGSESISSGSFDSYIVTYTGPTTTTDSSGTHISIGITNDTKSVRLRVTKIDGDTGEYLSGAVFRLRLVDDNLEIDSSFDALTLTSGTDGTLTFTDIPYGTYLLTETTAPDGYSLISDAVYVTINTDDTVSVSGSYGGYAYVDSANAYSIIVENYEAVLLPATGGHRTLYSISGAMMMFAALVYITLKKRGWTS